MDRVFSVLPSVLSKRGLRKHAEAALLTHRVQSWLDTSLPDLRGYVSVTGMQDSSLIVTCSHSIAAQECHNLLPALKLFIAENCPFIQISDILLIRERSKGGE